MSMRARVRASMQCHSQQTSHCSHALGPSTQLSPASARKAAVTAGRRWKGLVTAARSVPNSTLWQKQVSKDEHTLSMCGSRRAGVAALLAANSGMQAHTPTAYGWQLKSSTQPNQFARPSPQLLRLLEPVCRSARPARRQLGLKESQCLVGGGAAAGIGRRQCAQADCKGRCWGRRGGQVSQRGAGAGSRHENT